jgi:hypothetical protein
MKTQKWSKSHYSLGILLLISSVIYVGCGKLKDEVKPKSPPTVITGEITNATAASATVSGQIVDDGNAIVSERGVAISKNTDPTINDTRIAGGSGEGTFTVDLTGLTAATTYHVRAYGTNSVGTSYGLDKTFTTSATNPTLTTSEASSISYTTVTIGGNISSDGGSAILSRGICYGTTPNPTTANQKTTESVGTGAFSSNLTSLSVSTKYYARAYATNAVGTSYGNEISFTTLTQVIPIVTTTAITEISVGSAKSGGNITNDGGSSITARGVCWGLNPNPTIADSKTSDGNGNGSFTSSISQLSSSKKYYVRAYATNSVGTAYGEELNFTTPASPIPLNGLVGWWPFNSNAKDESGNGYDLSTSNVTYSTNRFGIQQSTASFNGIELGGGSTMISNTTVFNIGQPSYSISIWVKIADLNQISRTIFDTYPFDGIGIGFNNNNAPGYMQYSLGSASGTNNWTNLYLHGTKNDYTTNDWYHLLLTKDNLTYTFYVNGILEHSYTNNAAAGYNNNVKFRVSGISPDVQIFHGLIDDIAIYNRALTADEILKIYNGTGF